MKNIVSASDGALFNPDELPSTFAYNADGTLASSSVVFNGNTYVQSYAYTSGKVTAISQWIKQ